MKIDNIIGYMPKLKQNLVFQIWVINIKDIAINITKMRLNTYQ